MQLSSSPRVNCGLIRNQKQIMFIPIKRMHERAESSKEDSDFTYFMNLLYAGEQLVKIVAAGFVACMVDDRQRHKYSQMHRLVRADGVGEWAAVIDEILTGPSSHYLLQEAQPAQREMTQKFTAGTWQFDSIQLIEDCLRELGQSPSELSTKAPGKTWFSHFAWLRNKTRGHGALQPATCAKLCQKLSSSIELLTGNFSLLQCSWVYLHRNLSGKYRITYLNEKTEHFNYLKSSRDENLNNGVYFFLGRPLEAELMYSDVEATDFRFPNGSFNGKRFECLSYITDTKEWKDASPYMAPRGELPESETQGISKLDVIGNCFSNLPSISNTYVNRLHLEDQLLKVLLDDRHPLVTLVGRGGIGKTTLALSVLHQLCEKYQAFSTVLWFSARDIDLLLEGAKPVKPQVLTESDVAAEFTSLMQPREAREKGFNPKHFMERELTKSSVGPILIVLDNYETVKNPADLFHWLDTYIRLPNKILITTRCRDFKADYPIEVKGMSEYEFRKLVDSTSVEFNIPRRVLTEDYMEDLFSESDGHPYVVKILLGEVAKAGKTSKIERIVASKDEILTALFERTYLGLTPAAKRIFLTLSNWRSVVPYVAVEAVLMRSDNERMDVEDAIEELVRSSFIEVSQSQKDSMLFISVPLSASLFGLKKLGVSSLKTAIQADTDLLRAFGAGKNTSTIHGIKPRIHVFFQNIAKRISSGKESIEKYASILEFICGKYPDAWLMLASLYEEEAYHQQAKEAIQRFLENTADDNKKIDAWHTFIRLCLTTKDWLGIAHALLEIAQVPNIAFTHIATAMNVMMTVFQIEEFILDDTEKEILIQRLIAVVEPRLEKGEGDCDNWSSLAWLYLHLNDRKTAKEIVKNVLSRKPNHTHSIKLARKLSINTAELCSA